MADGKGDPKLREEIKVIAEKWSGEVSMERPPKGSEGFPFPMIVQRKIPQPEAAALWDVDFLNIKLKILSKGATTAPVSVQVMNKLIPKPLKTAISEKLTAQWKADLTAGGGAWFLEDIFGWAEAKFVDLLCLCPELVDRYDTGYSELRYAIKEPAEEPEEEVDEEEEARLAEEAAAAWEAKEMERLIKAAEKKDAEAAEKRKAAEDGLDSDLDGPRKLSKKQQDAMAAAKKASKGQRWAKAPSKASKFTGDGSAVDKAKSAKQKRDDEDPLIQKKQMGNQCK